MDAVPREAFVPTGRESLAYSDAATLVSEGADTAEPRAMLAPMVLARLIQSLAITPGTRVLDVACGLGYGSAVMAALGGEVTALENSDALAAEAHRRLAGRDGILAVKSGPLAEGAPDRAPFDAILVNGLVEIRPAALLGQLGEGGRLACLQRIGGGSRAVLYVRAGDSAGHRVLFDAQAPALGDFRQMPAFAF